jgi:probable F420-dependent oxidoreductase
MGAGDEGVKLGVVFPQLEIGNDPAAIRDFAQAAEALGYTHLLAYDHVLGADPDREGGWAGPYTKDTPFHEPLVLFAYLAGLTTSLEFVTGVLILPQRQAALVAKQAAELAILSGGRLRLGVGTGWNAVEYEALAEDFHNRGRRQEEQIELMRRLWAEDVIDFNGRWHRVDHAGINPRPAATIPIWFGGGHEAVLQRAARIGDGWLPLAIPGPDLDAAKERLAGYLRAAGRDPASFGLEGFVNIEGDPDRWPRQLEAWESAGATHVSLRTFPPRLRQPREGVGPADHLDAIRRYREALA